MKRVGQAEMVRGHRWSDALMNELAFVVECYISLYVVRLEPVLALNISSEGRSTLCVRHIARHARPAVSCLTTIGLHHYRFLSYFERLLETCKGVWLVARYICTCVCHWRLALPALLLRLPNRNIRVFLIIKLFKSPLFVISLWNHPAWLIVALELHNWQAWRVVDSVANFKVCTGGALKWKRTI